MRIVPACVISAAALGALWLASPDPVHAASFDCARARAADERAVCGVRALEDRDVRMATLYSVNRQLAGGMGALGALQDRQRDWLVERSRCRADAACIRNAYDRRIGELERAVQAASRR